MKWDVVIAGGGLGGCAAALAACRGKLRVLLIEETDWLGGQSSAQGVPPDEHPWIEEFGCTASYREYRDRIRSHYLNKTPVLASAKSSQFNPGEALVSKICHEPGVSAEVLLEMLKPHVNEGLLTIKLNTRILAGERRERNAVALELIHENNQSRVEAPYFIDATETGELLALLDLPYRTGAEAKSETGEPHARETADPLDIQAFTYVLAMEHRPGESHVIEKPEMYDYWKSCKPDIWPDAMLSFYAPHPHTGEKRPYSLFGEDGHFPLWTYRRCYSATQFEQGESGDISLMNWPQNDYFFGNIYDVSEEEKEKHIYRAKQLSLSLLYWLQTEAPLPDGGIGYPGLRLRMDVFNTEDGLAKAPYIRESRRMNAHVTVKEQDVSPSFHPEGLGTRFNDSVGIGSYSIDLHPSMSGNNYLDIPALPFHIPLGALIPVDADNVLGACKNIGTTHITNGCFRLHPVEWNIGEAAGEAVSYALQHHLLASAIREDEGHLTAFQQQLTDHGVEIDWPDGFKVTAETASRG
ncbi:hypothetical protein KP78_13220 [Jeotgalibacillus soli]|uniref:FAD-dependent oxidoreductase n=2 Tax=Jeotgalibacillus soli TaxID=889306 RepID=A0A0C2S749_9BACL|nr:hypothetical protein KP78_13220 [Jeotgalibacillus soli]